MGALVAYTPWIESAMTRDVSAPNDRRSIVTILDYTDFRVCNGAKSLIYQPQLVSLPLWLGEIHFPVVKVGFGGCALLAAVPVLCHAVEWRGVLDRCFKMILSA